MYSVHLPQCRCHAHAGTKNIVCTLLEEHNALLARYAVYTVP